MCVCVNVNMVLFIFGCAGSSLLCGLSLVAVSGDAYLVAVCWLLIVVAFLVMEHQLKVCRLQ